MRFSNALAALGGLAVAAAIPTENDFVKRNILSSSLCGNPVDGLSKSACQMLASITPPFASMGKNSKSGQMSVGSNGPNVFSFTNGGNEELTVVGWIMNGYTSMCMNVAQGEITYSLGPGESVDISLVNGIQGAFSAVYKSTKMSIAGSIGDTWLEYHTGSWATLDVSREVNMHGHSISATVNGCKTDMDTCVYKCESGDSCTTGYKLHNCAAGSQPGADTAFDPGMGGDSGGCKGWDNGGHIKVQLNGNGAAAPAPAPTSAAPPPPPPPSSTPTPTPTPSPSPVVQSAPVQMLAAATPTPTPSDEPLSVVVVKGDQALHELSEVAVKAFSS